MDFSSIFGKVRDSFGSLKSGVKNNDTLILTGISCVGVFVTGILAYKAGKNINDLKRGYDSDVIDILEDNDAEKANELTKERRKEFVVEVVKEAVPAVLAIAGTVACDIAREKKWIGKFTEISAIAAYNMKRADTFEKKTKEMLGQGKVDKINDEIAKDKAKEIYSGTYLEPINTGSGNTLFVSLDTGQMFYSSREFVESAFNKFNRDVLLNGANVETPADDLLYYLGLKSATLIENKIFDPEHFAEPRYTHSSDTINGVMRDVTILEITGNKRPQWRDSLL